MADCKKCFHRPVCDLWREQECQDASCFSQDGCNCYAPDVKPVVHGRWVQESKYTSRCSECRFPIYPRDRTRHCPNCGAKMDVFDKDAGKRRAET